MSKSCFSADPLNTNTKLIFSVASARNGPTSVLRMLNTNAHHRGCRFYFLRYMRRNPLDNIKGLDVHAGEVEPYMQILLALESVEFWVWSYGHFLLINGYNTGAISIGTDGTCAHVKLGDKMVKTHMASSTGHSQHRATSCVDIDRFFCCVYGRCQSEHECLI